MGLPLIRSIKPPKPSGVRQAITVGCDRVNLVASREQIGPLEVVYADFTELVCADGRRKAYLILLVHHASKMALGWAVGERAVTELALEAWARAKQTLIRYGVGLRGFIVHHDQDPVFTSYGWTDQLLLEDLVRISYALNGARDNPETEGFISRFKTENRSLLLDAQSLGDLQSLVTERMGYHNGERRHSTIGYRAPAAYVATLSRGRSVTNPRRWECPTNGVHRHGLLQPRAKTLNDRLLSTREIYRDSAAMGVASQFRGLRAVQEMGCTPDLGSR